MTGQVQPAAENPCKACPWLTANHGKRTPDGWYTKTNLRRLWRGMRDGEAMTCHPTDPGNPVTDEQAAFGHKRAPSHSQVRECTGSLIIEQREFMVLQELHGSDIRAYRKARPQGMTKRGLVNIVERAIFGGGPLGGARQTRPNLNLPVSMHGLDWPLGHNQKDAQ